MRNNVPQLNNIGGGWLNIKRTKLQVKIDVVEHELEMLIRDEVDELALLNIYDLSLNMGCKVKQIENHYSHVVTEKRRKKITQYNWQTEKKLDSDLSGDAFLAEAVRLNNAGKISDEALLAIVKSGADIS